MHIVSVKGKTYEIKEAVYYLALQDGPYDKRTFDNYEDALLAYEKLRDTPEFPGICIMNYWR